MGIMGRIDGDKPCDFETGESHSWGQEAEVCCWKEGLIN